MSDKKPFAFQKGDKFWLKRASVITKGKSGPKGGAPLAFASAEVLLEACYEYFNYEYNRTWSKPEAIKGGEFAGQLVNVTVKTPFMLQGLCVFLGVNTHYFNDFEDRIKKEKKRIEALPEAEITEDDKAKLILNTQFSEVIKHVRDIIDKQKAEGALIGAFNATLVSQMIGLATKTQSEITGANGGPIESNSKLIIEVLSTGVGVSNSEQQIQDAINKELEA